MKKLIMFLFVVALSKYATSQTLSPEVISSSGSSMSDGTTTLDWTLGETVTSTLDNGTAISTQGFHQPNLIVTSIGNSTANNTVVVFPNPTIDAVQLQFTEIQKNTVVELFSVEGKLLQMQMVNSMNAEFNVSTYAAGTYYFKINGTQTHELIKSN